MIFTAGILVAKVGNHDKRLDGHETRLDTHEGRLNDHSVKIEKAEAWRDGYNAGKSK
jgi:hypothetical protein